jgi:GTP cyclohydrolase II
MSTVSVGPAPGGFIRFTFGYHKELIDDIKSGIPAYARAYRPAAKAWDVRPSHTEMMRSLIRKHLGVCLAPTEDGHDELHELRCEVAALRAKLRDAVFVPEPCRALHVLPSAPPQVIAAAHKALVRLHHPDKGGDLLRMQRINDAADQLRKEAS